MQLGSRDIAGVTHRAQDVTPGDAFVAIAGSENDGHGWIDEAVRRGAACIIAERQVAPARVPVIRVKNSRRVYACLASRLYGHPSKDLMLLGVTGTNGKSTTSHLLQHLLRPAACGLIGTTGCDTLVRHHPPGLTTPDSLQLQSLLDEMLKAGARFAVMEVSSHASQQHRVDGVRFNLGVWTNLSPDHLDYHGDFRQYRDAKGRFLASIPRQGWLVMNADDAHFDFYRQQVRAQVLAYGRGPGCHVCLLAAEPGPKGLRVRLRLQGALGRGCLDVETGLLGRHQVNNIMAAVTAASLFVSRQNLALRLASFPGVWRRMQVISRSPVTVIDDCAHNPASYRAVLGAAAELLRGGSRCFVMHGLRGGRGAQVVRANAGIIGGWCRQRDAVWVAALCMESAGPRDQVRARELKAHEETRRRYADVPYCRYRRLEDALAHVAEQIEPGDLLLLLGPHPMDEAADSWRQQVDPLQRPGTLTPSGLPEVH